MLKRIVRKLRNVSFINQLGRQVIRTWGVRSNVLYNRLTAYWLVSGQINYKFPGGSINLISHADDAFTTKLFYKESWEEEVVFWITKLNEKASVFFDVGANIGFYSLVSLALKPGLKVVAFEPNPINHTRIKENLSINKFSNIILEEKAVGAIQGKVKIYLPELPYISDVSSVYKSHSTSFNGFKHLAHEVDVISIDEFCSTHSTYPDTIKIDVELYEFEVLRGMKNIFEARQTSIFCEIFNDEVKRKTNKNLDSELPLNYTYQIEKLLKQYDYYFYSITNQGILYQNTLRSSTSTYMYLLLPKKLKQEFYLKEEASIVLNEIYQ